MKGDMKMSKYERDHSKTINIYIYIYNKLRKQIRMGMDTLIT